MNNKIYEEALSSALKRIEDLEDKISRISIPNKEGFHEPQKINLATSSQIWKIKTEGGTPWEGITKQEATKEIDRLLKGEKTEVEVIEPKEVDTDEAGLVGDLM